MPVPPRLLPSSSSMTDGETLTTVVKVVGGVGLVVVVSSEVVSSWPWGRWLRAGRQVRPVRLVVVMGDALGV